MVSTSSGREMKSEYNRKVRIVEILSYVLMIPAGVFLIVFGEADDSPGAQFLGLVIAALGFWGMIRRRKGRRP